MKLIKIGCGCVVLVIHQAQFFEKSVVRVLESCAEEGLGIQPERLLSEIANPENIKPDCLSEVSADETLRLFDDLAELVGDGYAYREMQSVLRRAVKSEEGR